MKINFIYSPPYDELLSEMSNILFSDEQIIELREYTQKLTLEWRKTERKIIKEIESTAGLKFKKNVDCFVVKNMGFKAISNPLTLKFNKNIDQLKADLIHELIHVLFLQNSNKILNLITNFHPEKDHNFQLHFPLLLIQKRVLTNMYGESFFSSIFKKESSYQDLKELLPLVNQTNFKRNIIKFLKKNASN